MKLLFSFRRITFLGPLLVCRLPMGTYGDWEKNRNWLEEKLPRLTSMPLPPGSYGHSGKKYLLRLSYFPSFASRSPG